MELSSACYVKSLAYLNCVNNLSLRHLVCLGVVLFNLSTKRARVRELERVGSRSDLANPARSAGTNKKTDKNRGKRQQASWEQ